MRNKIITFGSINVVLWSVVSVISKGVPIAVVRFLDNITFRLFTKEINQLEYGFYYQVNNNNMPTVIFILLFFISFLIMLRVFHNSQMIKVNSRSIGLVVFFAIVLRAILLPSEPIHENDFYRYLWDGKSINNGINPYKYAPADLFMYEEEIEEDYYDENNDVTITYREFSDEDKLNLDKLIILRDQNPRLYYRIGHWQVPTIYPPVAEIMFAITSKLKVDSFVMMKFLFMLFDVGVIFIIIALLKHFNLNTMNVVLYAWSPLVLKEFANSGHYDPVVIFFTMLSILLFFKAKDKASVFVLALSVLSKFYSGVLLPFYLKRVKISNIIIFAVTIFLFYVPFFMWNDITFKEMFQGLATYNQFWAYNASVFSYIYVILDKFAPSLTESYLPVKVITGLLYLVFLSVLFFTKQKDDLHLFKKFFFAVAVLFIINPVGDPWYYCWVIPFLCVFPYKSWILLSSLLILSYLNFHSDMDFIDKRVLSISTMSWVTYIPFFLCLFWENFVEKFKKKSK